MIDGKYEYFAFISYKEEDAKWAKWLQRKLEHYKLPTALRKENPDLPERISPIYEYKSEAGGGRLKEVIWKGLTSSKYLIVICSPRATKSEWLNNGIRYFVESEQEENIIPFIIEGKPKAENPDDECFPSELLKLKGDRELRGININEMGRDAAAVKVISRMFDLKFDTLWQRHEREQKKRRNWVIAGTLAIVLSILGISGYIIKKNIDLNNAYERISQQNIILDAKNDSIALANKKILAANDSITKQKIQLQKAYNDLELSQKTLAKTNTDLNERSIQLKGRVMRELSRLSIDNLNDGKLDGSYSALMNMDTLIEKFAIPYTPEYENALLQYYNYWNLSGIKPVSRRQLKGSSQWNAISSQIGIISDENTFSYFTLENNVLTMYAWDFIHNNIDSVKDLESSMPTYMKILESSGHVVNDNVINWENDLIYLNNIYSGISYGKAIPFKGDSKFFQYQTYYRLRPSGKDVIITKDSTLYIGNFNDGKLLVLCKFSSGISSFCFNPQNSNILALATNDSIVYLYNIEQKKIVTQSQKMDFIINGVTFHPEGKDLLVYGNGGLALLDRYLFPNIFLTESTKNFVLYILSNISNARFNDRGNRLFLGNEFIQTLWLYNNSESPTPKLNSIETIRRKIKER